MAAPTLPATLDFPRIKIMTIGNTGVGKSCLVKRYCEGRFVSKYIPTIGIDYGVKLVNINAAWLQEELANQPAGREASPSMARPPTSVRVNFWDIAGGPESFEIRNEFYAPAQGILLVYNVGDLKSFEALDEWMEELNSFISVPFAKGAAKRASVAGPTMTGATPAGREVGTALGQSPVIFLCANKVDSGVQRVVLEEQGRRWAEAHGHMEYFEASANTDLNVTMMMETLFHKVIARFMTPQ